MNKDFYIDYKIRVKPDRIEKIEKKVENGLLVLVVYWKKSNKSNLKIQFQEKISTTMNKLLEELIGLDKTNLLKF